MKLTLARVSAIVWPPLLPSATACAVLTHLVPPDLPHPDPTTVPFKNIGSLLQKFLRSSTIRARLSLAIAFVKLSAESQVMDDAAMYVLGPFESLSKLTTFQSSNPYCAQC